MQTKYHTDEERRAAQTRAVVKHHALMAEEGLTLNDGIERLRIALGLRVGVSRRAVVHAAADRLEEDPETARRLARLFYHWALWHDDLMAQAFCVQDMEELDALNQRTMDEYERWRDVRESGLRHANPWIMVPPEKQKP